jgi:hypothetical protein
MSIGLSNGSVTWAFSCEPKLVTQYGEGGTPRSVAISLSGQPIVTEYLSTQLRRKLVLRWEAVPKADCDTIRTLLDGSGPLDLTYLGNTELTVVPGDSSEHSFEPVFGSSLPYGAPERLNYWKVQLTLYIIDDVTPS